MNKRHSTILTVCVMTVVLLMGLLMFNPISKNVYAETLYEDKLDTYTITYSDFADGQDEKDVGTINVQIKFPKKIAENANIPSGWSKSGDYTITATVKQASFTYFESGVKLEDNTSSGGIAFVAPARLKVGETLKISKATFGGMEGYTLNITSSNPSSVNVSEKDGVFSIKAVSPGSATLVGVANPINPSDDSSPSKSISLETKIYVEQNQDSPDAWNVTYNKNSSNLNVGDTDSFTVNTVKKEEYSTATEPTVEWKINDENVAKVVEEDSSKHTVSVKAIGEGKTYLTCTVKFADGSTAKREIPVNVNKKNEQEDVEEKTVVEFKDENFYNAVVEALGDKVLEKGNNKITIKNEDLIKFEELKATDKNISDISGIEKFTNLKVIDFGSNNIKDISPLQYLDKLSTIYLGFNKVEDITPLKNLKNIEYISLGHNNVSLDALKVIEQMIDAGNMSKLKGIWLFELNINGISDVEYITKLATQLTLVDLHGNNISDISFLNKFTNLGVAYLFDNKIDNAQPVKDLKDVSIYRMYRQSIELKTDRNVATAPAMLKQAFEFLGATKIETENCKVSDDKQTITIEDTSKEAKVKIIGGNLSNSVITVKYEANANKEEKSPSETQNSEQKKDETTSKAPIVQAGEHNIMIVTILGLGVIAIISYRKFHK